MNKFALALTLLTAPACWAEGVALAGIMGSKALVVVDGSTPKALAAGESFKGVTLIAAKGDSAVVEVDGQRQTLRLGGVAAVAVLSAQFFQLVVEVAHVPNVSGKC